GDVGRIEIGGKDVRPRIGCRHEVGGETLPAAEVAVAERLTAPTGCRDAARERREAQDRRRLHTAEIVDVGRVRDVSGAPIGHTLPRRTLLRSRAKAPQGLHKCRGTLKPSATREPARARRPATLLRRGAATRRRPVGVASPSLARNSQGNAMTPARRVLQLAACAAALAGLPGAASALDYPTRPVHLVVGFPPGQNADIGARLIGDFLSQKLGQTFVIDNKPGAASTIGTEFVVRAPADGYTLLWVVTSNYINASLYKKLPYDFI